VIGLGKIGLPLAVQFASAGFAVVGCDVDADVVAGVNAGRTANTTEPGLGERLAQVARKGTLRATVSTEGAVREAQLIVLVPPVLLNPARGPDFSHLDAAAAAVGRGLMPGSTVILETT